jgi:hypothetical protein
MLADVEVLDPARAGSLSTLNSIAPLYHQLLTYDYGARPVRLIPYAATALPQLSADRRSYTLKLRPGLLFAPHPAFGGKPRELVAVTSLQLEAPRRPRAFSMSFANFEADRGLDEPPAPPGARSAGSTTPRRSRDLRRSTRERCRCASRAPTRRSSTTRLRG